MEKRNKSSLPIILFTIVLAIATVALIVAGNAKDQERIEKETAAISSSQSEESSSEEETEISSSSTSYSSSFISSSSSSTTSESTSNFIPREYQNALRSAKNYLSYSAFSKQGLYEQLISEYGEQYPAEAAQYAVDNCGADWKSEALESAKNYLKYSPMSDAELYEQLTSEYGENFTPEEAQYAIDNLPK